MSIPESFYRNAIDLNRFSNSVARRIINAYNDILINSATQLRLLNEANAPQTAARLRALIAQTKDSLATWAGDASELLAPELQGIAELQSSFTAQQLRDVLPTGARDAVRTVEISPQFAESVVTTDPTQLNIVVLSDDLYAAVEGAEALARQAGTGAFNLTAAQGAAITLPNGEVVSKAFRGIATDSAERFGQVIRQGLLSGETTDRIIQRLIGKLQFGERARTIAQTIAAGGQATAIADNQITSLVRTSINQVANTAAMNVYESNLDITDQYQYVATLDSKTSAICRALDGKRFKYGQGPTPPQHFGCRSKVVAYIDFEKKYGIAPPEGTRASALGQVPESTTYGTWLYTKQKGETAADLRKRQEQALGPGRVPYFNRLAAKYGPEAAIAKFVRNDGSELTLEQLRSRYGAIKKG